MTNYRQDGYLVVRGLLAHDELRPLYRECDRLLATDGLVHPDNMRCRFHYHPQSGAQILDAIDPVSDLSLTIGAVATGETLLATV